MDKPTERRLAAVLHADVVGYSRLMAADEDATVRGVRELRGTAEGVVRQHRGRLVDFTGDSFLAEFPSAVDAVSAALAIQRQSEAQNALLAENARLRPRIGVHVGELRAEGEQIFGDPIHVAARLQTLAEPGGVCISGTLRDQLAGRMDLELRDLGLQSLKHLPHPVQSYAVSSRSVASADAAPPVPGFSGRPAIAVLAFAPFGGDAEQEYLGDGIAEDVITRLATLREFPVIARNSSFAYKGRSVDVKQIGRELGVLYLIEGSVRRSGTRVRVTAQLVDTRSGHHVWAERYDRELADVFAIQDEIVEAVVSRVYPELMRAERERVQRHDPASLDAWECAVLARFHVNRYTRDDNLRAISLARRALELDPGCAEAVQVLQSSHVRARVNQWNDQLVLDNPTLLMSSRRAIEFSGESPPALIALGSLLTFRGDHEEGVDALQRAVRLNPSSTNALVALANALTRGDRAAEALPLLETATRLDPNPFDPHFRAFTYAFTYWALGRHEEGVRFGKIAVSQVERHAGALRVLISSLVELGRLDEARRTAQTLVDISPDFRISLLEQIIPWQPALIPRFAAALRRAGLPE
jgi:adenylate cyclase